MTDFGSPNVSASVKKECVLVVFREKRMKMMFGRYFFDFQNRFGRGISLRDAFWSFSSENVKNRSSSNPKKTRSRLSSDFFVNLEGVLPVVREKVENKSVATFYDVYDVFDPNFGPFSTFRPD